jgi:hypothetical protein
MTGPNSSEERHPKITNMKAGSPREKLYRLHAILSTDSLVLLRKKNHDYASSDDPYRNFRTFGAMGILVRLSDKLARLQSYIENGTLLVQDESVDDTCKDIINYTVLFKGFLEELKNEVGNDTMESKRGLGLGPIPDTGASSTPHVYRAEPGASVTTVTTDAVVDMVHTSGPIGYRGDRSVERS